MTSIACIDQGTSSTRCLVVEDGGVWRQVASLKHQEHYPALSWVEHDAEELLGNIKTVLAAAGRVDGIAIANQGESCLAWDALTGQPLSPVVVWKDSRTSAHLASMPQDAHSLSRNVCGLPLDPYFSASKLAWLLGTLPAVARAFEAGTLRLGTTDAFFLDRLTGNFVTDLTTASRTGLLDLQTGHWSNALCSLHGVPMQCLPRIASAGEPLGAIDGVPVLASVVDQQAALFGHGCRHPGACKITFGTGAFLLAVAGSERPTAQDLLPTIAWADREDGLTYAIEGGVYDAGAALAWAHQIGLYSAVQDLDTFDGPSALSRGLVFVPAFSGLAAPHWDRHAAPLFIGMGHSTNRRDMIRAVLEGIALLTATLVKRADHLVSLGDTISIDGGLSQSTYFAQFLASACGKTIVVPATHEMTSIGLAELCGVNVTPARASGRRFAPHDPVSAAHHELFETAIAHARDWPR
ncbi:FGGY family carbohydrate kinase [Devosia sp. MC521]|uniref:FGGY family carbohydrate kinase n=1 Tax=Devosia sp. MC521 TaxID=2759954 RepID=UPI0015FD0455|nr:FGGY family carbohydrate kinase [Devosia sp. MC521]MBJ6987287.1 glycerol kinase [Devosia sp. MC521]QMW62894.1 glycerol kinase [Devosia sp. MC521]